jgi:hypothetical protein
MQLLSFLFTGGIAAAITAPLDVAKTRIMLAEVSSIFFSLFFQSRPSSPVYFIHNAASFGSYIQ